MDSAQQLGPRWSLTSSGLKLIAMVTMALDHVGAIVLERILVAQGGSSVNSPEQMQAFMAENGALYWADFALRLVGRIAFPLFCFLLVEGFLHTRSRMKYLRNMAVFALLSEPFFDLAVFGEWFTSDGNNVYFTLTLGLLVLFGLEVVPRMDFQRGVKTVLSALVILAGSLAAVWLRTDYSYYGVVAIAAFYLLRERRKLGGVAACAALTTMGGVQAGCFLSLIPLGLYNGQRGRLGMKYFFYAFYPLHLLLLYGVAVLLGYGAYTI